MFYQVIAVLFIVCFIIFIGIYSWNQRLTNKYLMEIRDSLSMDFDEEEYVNEDDDELVLEENSNEEVHTDEEEYIENLKRELNEIPENSNAYKELASQIRRYENMLGMGIKFLGNE